MKKQQDARLWVFEKKFRKESHWKIEWDEIIEKAKKNPWKGAWGLPKFDIKFIFEEVLLRNEIFKQMVLEKKYYRSKPVLYPLKV